MHALPLRRQLRNGGATIASDAIFSRPESPGRNARNFSREFTNKKWPFCFAGDIICNQTDMEGAPSNLVETEALIRAVKRHPGLYRKNHPSYFHKSNHKPKIWHEVCREVVPNWDTMKSQDKVSYMYNIQKRWKNLRTCFSRELLLRKQEQEKRRNNERVKQRKIYGYYKMMKFLIDKEEDGDIDDEEDNNSDEDNYEPLANLKTEAYDENEVTLEFEQETFVQAFEHKPVRHEKKASSSSSQSQSDGKVLDYLKSVKQEESDEDKQFLLSLIPTFRKLDDKQKIEARIEILKVLKGISFQSDAGTRDALAS